MKIAIALIVLGGAFLFFLWFLLRGQPAVRTFEPDDVEAINERNPLAVAERAWRTGKPVLGEVDEDGNLTMTEIE